jgi:ElaB/YqjD/DUF883 family membrane-anchored ribosome-binding protein
METTNGEETLSEDVGAVQQATTELAGDAAAPAVGKAMELTGKAQKLSADVADILRKSTAGRPLAALAIAAGVGFILGALRASGRHQQPYDR